MGTKIGELRESLMDAIEMVKRGDLVAEDAIAISKLASEISRSLQVEGALRAHGAFRESPEIGHLPIGQESPPIEEIPQISRNEQGS